MTNENEVNLLKRPVKVINVGLEAFAQDLERQSVPTIHLEWSPPASVNPLQY